MAEFLADGGEPYFPLGFQVSRQASETFSLHELLAESIGTKGSGRVASMRQVAARINTHCQSDTYPVTPIHAGQLMGWQLLTEVLRYMLTTYSEHFPDAMGQGIEAARQQRGETAVALPIQHFVELYPGVPVLSGTESQEEFFLSVHPWSKREEWVVGEQVLLFLAANNPALKPFRELFEDTLLRRRAPYVPLVEHLERHFKQQPSFPKLEQKLFELLWAPIRECPNSIEAQLEYIRNHWGVVLPDSMFKRLLLAMDVMHEETRDRRFGGVAIDVLTFQRDVETDYPEYSRFTMDRDWMSNVVLIAKCVYVWLDQLSKKYQRRITRLDEIPDEELDRLGRWGFTGLWLIGVWERSNASRRIKEICGNPEAAASAYSLYDYEVAWELGGNEAYENLRNRAWQRGIRLAADMVPNHMGVYSRWIIEHPDWFLQLSAPPYPNYQFNGVDLSEHGDVCIQIEDGYWDNRDAAVVFRRIDKRTGETRYIYHGNDGTSMPWNDTAQLNYLLPAVREAVIQTILHVARHFPIIRFDAAMTLAKRHFQRLWFPKPGTGGAIPSRAEHSMTQAEFDAAFPHEFWREVVDRVTAEAPDTLLLAEAFWLMEGYFVRTLGMHRVYNSAFMNMLKMEENQKYRETIKNVLAFSPEVLKRFVNFMNNPDERTAVDQFGRDDKYFGVAVMLVTLPGLPMIGHGQVEGLTEKYGMEYRRAYWDEQTDDHMVWRHEQEVFPLMRMRNLFSHVDNFAFYDVYRPEGYVDENIFAYTNRWGDERALVLYNNAYTTTSGWVRESVPYNASSGEEVETRTRTLADALALNAGDGVFYAFRDHRTGLEYLRRGSDFANQGFFATLNGYQYKVLLNFRELHDQSGQWARLAAQLDGEGVPSVDDTLREFELSYLLDPLRIFLYDGAFELLVKAERPTPLTDDDRNIVLNALRGFLAPMLMELDRDNSAEAEVVAECIVAQWEALGDGAADDASPLAAKMALFSLVFNNVCGDDALKYVDRWLVPRIIAAYFKFKEQGAEVVQQAVATLRLALRYPDAAVATKLSDLLPVLFDADDAPVALGLNQHQEVWYIRGEALIACLAVFEQLAKPAVRPVLTAVAKDVLAAADEVGYDALAFAARLKDGAPTNDGV